LAIALAQQQQPTQILVGNQLGVYQIALHVGDGPASFLKCHRAIQLKSVKRLNPSIRAAQRFGISDSSAQINQSNSALRFSSFLTRSCTAINNHIVIFNDSLLTSFSKTMGGDRRGLVT
jgi:hypothetical protein